MDIRQGKTKPPKPYTEGQLINMMITAGKAVDDDDDKEILKETEGIGTEATRASIIETLKKQNNISVNNNKVEVTAKGKVLCRTVENTILASPSMTADWEKHLKKLGNGQGTQANFLKNIQRLIDKLLNDAPVKVQNKELNSYIDSVKDQFKEKKKPKSKKKFKTRKKVSK